MHQFFLRLDIPPLRPALTYRDRILLLGSCFTEHMATRLESHQFTTLQNPHGILFNPLSVASALESYARARTYTADELFEGNELWNSWAHHSRFSHPDRDIALAGINASQQAAGAFLRSATTVIITLGSAFQYYLEHGEPVANNHRMSAGMFRKVLLTVEEITSALRTAFLACREVNPALRFILTISPVRHIRDGVVENNRSKARLIEAVHALTGASDDTCYFPAYELVIDVLRDYRFYDIDGVHPNYAATNHVWEQFVEACIAPEIRPLMKELQSLATSAAHRPRFPETESHRLFCRNQLARVVRLQQAHPYLKLEKLARAFEQGGRAEGL